MAAQAHPVFTPELARKFPGLVVAQSTRHGGVSRAPFASLNLGLYTKDAPRNVLENRRRFFTLLDIPESRVAGAFQVHGHQIEVTSSPGQKEGYDALITNEKDLYLTVTVADCVPVLLYDPVQEAIAAVHAGWRGTVAQIGPKALTALSENYGVDPANCHAYIGTCIGASAYEVDAEVADNFPGDYKRWDEEKEKFYLDLKAANATQLKNAGIPEAQIEVSPYCTVRHNDHYFSHRKEKGKTGRMLGVIGMRS